MVANSSIYSFLQQIGMSVSLMPVSFLPFVFLTARFVILSFWRSEPSPLSIGLWVRQITKLY